MRVIRTHGLQFSLRNCFKKCKYKKLLLLKLLGNIAYSPLIVKGDQDTWVTVFTKEVL